MSPTTLESNSQSAISGVIGGLLAIGVIVAISVASVITIMVVIKRKQGRITLKFKKGCCIRLLYYG